MWRALLIFAVACSSSSGGPSAPHGKLELVAAPAVQDVAPLVASEVAKAQHDGKRLLVYVGAPWCEPCQHFHDAAAAGKLDDQFGELRLLVFDDERDGPALGRAGYTYKMIPMFALPNADGTASGKNIQGSIKGDGAVAQIAPRLHALLAP